LHWTPVAIIRRIALSVWASNPTSHGTGRIREVVASLLLGLGSLVTGVGLEPTTNGLTYLIGFRRPPLTGRGVERLDYTIAVAGVPRLVSEAGAGDPSVPCLLITQSPTFSDPHACRYRRRCGVRGSQGVPANCGIHSSRFGFFPREAPILGAEVRCSTD
jgi:hypothetical protein